MNGCTDVGGIVDTATLDGITVNVADGNFDVSVTASGSIAGKLSPGDRIRIDGSSQVCTPYRFARHSIVPDETKTC